MVARLDPLADYDRGDRGITAHNFYMVAPTLFEPTDERPDPFKQPTRGGLMPVVLSEVGSITLRSEHDLLASPDGQQAVAEGLLDGIASFFGERELAARIALADETVGQAPQPVAGDGPMFWAPVAPDGPVALRLTNTGNVAWPSGTELVAGWTASDQPYLATAPDELEPLELEIPALAPGESVVVSAELPPPTRPLARWHGSRWGLRKQRSRTSGAPHCSWPASHDRNGPHRSARPGSTGRSCAYGLARLGGRCYHACARDRPFGLGGSDLRIGPNGGSCSSDDSTIRRRSWTFYCLNCDGFTAASPKATCRPG